MSVNTACLLQNLSLISRPRPTLYVLKRLLLGFSRVDWEDRVHSCLACQARAVAGKQGHRLQSFSYWPCIALLCLWPIEMNTFGFIWPTMKGFDPSCTESITAVLVQCPEGWSSPSLSHPHVLHRSPFFFLPSSSAVFLGAAVILSPDADCSWHGGR